MIWLLFAIIIIVIAAPSIAERQRKTLSRAMRADAPGRFAKLPNGVTHYQWAGPVGGQPIVCVHGLSTPSYIWTALVKGLVTMGFRVLTYDLYGRGFSARPEGDQDAQFFRRQLSELLEDQGIDENPILVGYSMGGAIVVDYANTYPDKVQRLILLASAGLGTSSTTFVRFVKNVPVIGDGVMAVFGGWFFGRSEAAMQAAKVAAPTMRSWPFEERHVQGFFTAVLSSLRNILTVDQLDAHRAIAQNYIPLLAIWGEKDAVISLSAMGRLAQVNRAAYQDVVKGADHSLPLSHPHEIITIVQEFLREVV